MSYIKYALDGEVITKDMSGCDLDQVLTCASSMYAFSDCTDIEVLEVVCDGKRYSYNGWEPGMTFTFKNDAGETVWSNDFPDWDH